VVAEWDHRGGGGGGGEEKEIDIIIISKSRIVVQDQLFLGCQDFFKNFELQQPQRCSRILEDEGEG